MSLHLNLSTGKFLNSSTLFKLSDALLLDVSSGEIVMSNLLVPRAGVDLFKLASLDLNFAQRKTLTDRVSGNNLVTFSRASSGTYVGSDGLIKTSVVNLLTYSEQFDQSTWTKANGAQITPNAVENPSGGNTADLLTFTGSTQQLYFGFTPSAGTYTLSVYLRVASGSKQLRMQTYSPTDGVQNKDITVTDTWQRFSHTVVLSNTQTTFLPCSPVDLGEVYIWGAQLEEGSTATDYIPTGATISGAPRFDHDPVTGESLGLLIEEERTNLIEYSSDPSQSYWSKTRVTTTAVQESNPFNYTDVYRVRGTGSGSHELKPNVDIFTANTTSTFSAFATADGTGADAGLVQMRLYNLGHTSAIVNFDLSIGTANAADGLSGTTVNGHTWTISDYGLEPYGNGWYRVWMTAQASSAGKPGFVCINNINANDVGGVYSYTASETGGFLVAGIQLEVGSFKTSVIPTSGSTVTRSPDIASIEGTNFSSWYNQSEGTIFSDISPLDADSGRGYLFNNGSTVQRFGHNTDSTTGFALFMSRDGLLATSLAAAVSGMPKPIKTTIAYQSGSTRGVIDGGLQTLSAVTNTPNLINQVGLGCQNFDSTDFLNGHISRFAYFPTRKSDQDLIKITDGTLAPAIITYGITSPGGTFNLRSTGTVDYAVDWDSTGGYESSTSNTLAHTYTAGNYDLVVYSDGVYRPFFVNVTADVTQITSVVIGSGADLGTNLGNAWFGASNMTTFTCPFDVTSSVTNFYAAWYGCNSLTSFPLLDTSSGTSFTVAWLNCSSLTSFPLLNTSSGTTFSQTWYGCSLLTSFPLLDTSSGTNFVSTWLNCSSLTDFPLLNTSSGTNFLQAWFNCSSLTSFPELNTSSGTTFSQAWRGCSSLTTFPANMFDTTGTLIATAFTNAWQNCALTAQSIENILTSLDTNGATGISLSIHSGTNASKTTWSAAAVTAYDNLIGKGWTILFNA